MKIKFDSDDVLRLNKTIEISTMTIVVRAIFPKNIKYYPKFFYQNSSKCLYKI